MTTRTKYWLCQGLGWGAYVVIGFTAALAATGLTLSLVVGYALFFFYSVAMTDVLRGQVRQRGWLDLNWRGKAARLAPCAILIGTIQAVLVIGVDYGFHFKWWPYSNIFGLWISVVNATLMWTFLYVQITSHRRLRERETELQLALRDAELNALESQINPHFLFNCLNSIRALVIVDPPKAQEMLTRLANVLRHSLRGEREHTVALEGEVASVEDYLALETVRFEQRLQVSIEIADAARRCAVPPMLLQTLVENAIKHGIAHTTDQGWLAVRAARENGFVRIEVENTGQLEPNGGSDGNSKVGLVNTRERLRLLYGGRASLDLQGKADSVLATVNLPAETK